MVYNTAMEKEEFDAWMQAYEEIKAEMPIDSGARKISHLQTKDIVGQLESMNSTAIFLGVDPKTYEAVTVDITQNNLGPILIMTDADEDRVDLVTSMITGLRLLQDPKQVQYGLLTQNVSKWNIPKTKHQAGFHGFYENAAPEFLLSLASHAHSNKYFRQKIFIFIDNMNDASNMEFEARQTMRWLFLRGHTRGVFPVVTVDPRNKHEIHPWLNAFSTVISKTNEGTFRLNIDNNSLDFAKTV